MTIFYWFNIWEYQNTQFYFEYYRNCLINHLKFGPNHVFVLRWIVISDVAHTDWERWLLTQIKHYEWTQLPLLNQNNQENTKLSFFFFPLIFSNEYIQIIFISFNPKILFNKSGKSDEMQWRWWSNRTQQSHHNLFHHHYEPSLSKPQQQQLPIIFLKLKITKMELQSIVSEFASCILWLKIVPSLILSNR